MKKSNIKTIYCPDRDCIFSLDDEKKTLYLDFTKEGINVIDIDTKKVIMQI